MRLSVEAEGCVSISVKYIKDASSSPGNDKETERILVHSPESFILT